MAVGSAGFGEGCAWSASGRSTARKLSLIFIIVQLTAAMALLLLATIRGRIRFQRLAWQFSKCWSFAHADLRAMAPAFRFWLLPGWRRPRGRQHGEVWPLDDGHRWRRRLRRWPAHQDLVCGLRRSCAVAGL